MNSITNIEGRMISMLHKIKLIFSKQYRKEYEKKLKFARIMATNNAIMKGFGDEHGKTQSA